MMYTLLLLTPRRLAEKPKYSGLFVPTLRTHSRAVYYSMVSKHQKTLEEIFKLPIPSSILWKDIETMLVSLGAEIIEGNGSRVRIYLNGIRAVFHRPHPRKETDKGAVAAMKRFLIEAGVKHVKL